MLVAIGQPKKNWKCYGIWQILSQMILTSMGTFQMIQTTTKKLPVAHDSYDAILAMLHLEPEGPSTSAETLKWNSAIREIRAKFEYKFVRD